MFPGRGRASLNRGRVSAGSAPGGAAPFACVTLLPREIMASGGVVCASASRSQPPPCASDWRRQPLTRSGRPARVSFGWVLEISEKGPDRDRRVDTRRAPITSANFSSPCRRGTVFRRSVPPHGASGHGNEYGRADSSHPGGAVVLRTAGAPAIHLERTSATGLKHVDGAVSGWLRSSADTATSDFFICIGDQPACSTTVARGKPTGWGLPVRGLRARRERPGRRSANPGGAGVPRLADASAARQDYQGEPRALEGSEGSKVLEGLKAA